MSYDDPRAMGCVVTRKVPIMKKQPVKKVKNIRVKTGMKAGFILDNGKP